MGSMPPDWVVPLTDYTWKSNKVFQGFFWENYSPDTCKALYIIELSLKSCLVGPVLHCSFDASSPPGYCLQSHEILLK
jgi:hypothetical protein